MKLSAVQLAIRTGITAMRTNPVRALLATLGVAIGSAALVAILSVSDGVEMYARERVSRQGFDRIVIRPITEDSLDAQLIARRDTATISVADLATLEAALGPYQRATLSRDGVALTQIRQSANRRALAVRGIALTAPDSGGQPYSVGRPLTPAETREGRPVAVVSGALARAMIGDTTRTGSVGAVIGDSLIVGRRWLTIVGVEPDLLQPGQRGALRVTAPLDVVDREIAPTRLAPSYRMLSVVTTRAEKMIDMRRTAEAWLDKRDAGWRAKFRIESRSQSQLDDVRRGLLIFRLFMGTVTGITLIVGGIGIMNVLLASVAERTREIGVRKAIGARRTDILLQFLAESVIITGVGSAIGTAIGLGAAYAVTAIMRAQTQAVVYAATTAQTLLISASLAVLVGLAFGTYPALRAARLLPIDAIHTE